MKQSVLSIDSIDCKHIKDNVQQRELYHDQVRGWW
jgi:hypothetical protein